MHRLTEALRDAGCVFAEEEAAILLEAALQGDTVSEDSGQSRLKALAVRRISGEPLEHIVGWVDFAGLRLNVRPGVFVPRQRTRLLAFHSARTVSAVSDRRGAGRPAPVLVEGFCGARPVGSFVVVPVPGVRICVGDAQDEAVEAAVANVHQAAGASPAAGTTVDGHRLNCLRGLPEELRRGVDVIAAVPPYVPDTAADFLPREAVDCEPSSALFGGPDGLDLVRRLIDESVDWLRPEGTLLIELGREQAPTALAHAAGRGLAGQGRLGEDEQTVVVELRQAASGRPSGSAARPSGVAARPDADTACPTRDGISSRRR